MRLTTMLAIEANHEWLVGRGYIAQHTMRPLLEQRAQRGEEEVLELQAV